MMPVAMTIGGSDPSGGAGIQADLKVFQQFDVFGTSVVTLLTAQNTVGVREVMPCPVAFVAAQLDAVLEDLAPLAAKTGALGNAELVVLIADRARGFAFPLVVDPVMVSKSRDRLIDDEGQEAIRKHLLPQAWLITPNVFEAEVLSGVRVWDERSMIRAAEALTRLGPRHVLVKSPGGDADAADLLWTGEGAAFLRTERIRSSSTHGSGCAYAAAITACLARGMRLRDAVEIAKGFVTEAIRQSPGLGHGRGPLNLNLRPISCQSTGRQ